MDIICELNKEVFAIEIKASRSIHVTDLSGLASFSDYHGKKCRRLVFYQGDHRRRIGEVDIFPWQQGIKELGF